MISGMQNSTASAAISNKERGSQEELQKEIEGGEYTISTYEEDTEEWKMRIQTWKTRSEN